jgi:drug/metabolite transporter (DMT)-like permease
MQFQPGKAGPALRAAQSKTAGHVDRIVLGMAASAASFFMLNTMNVFAKLLSTQHSTLEVAFYRNVIAAIPFAVWFSLPAHREGLKLQSSPGPLVLRSVIGTASLVTTFRAFNALPMADAQALFFTSSLFAPVMGYFFLKEAAGLYRWGAVIVGFLGMLVIVRPSGTVNLTGVSFALTAAFMHATLGTLLRVLGRTERPETVTFYFLVIGAALTGLAMPFVATVPAWREIPLFIGAGISPTNTRPWLWSRSSTTRASSGQRPMAGSFGAIGPARPYGLAPASSSHRAFSSSGARTAWRSWKNYYQPGPPSHSPAGGNGSICGTDLDATKQFTFR